MSQPTSKIGRNTTAPKRPRRITSRVCLRTSAIPLRLRNRKAGQRRLPLGDVVFAATFKIFSTLSGRRFVSDLREAKQRGHISSLPHYNSIFRYLENPDLTPILTDLIEQSSLPLKSVETDFAIDSSGFSTSKFERWFSHKYGRETFQRQWVKVHILRWS